MAYSNSGIKKDPEKMTQYLVYEIDTEYEFPVLVGNVYEVQKFFGYDKPLTVLQMISHKRTFTKKENRWRQYSEYELAKNPKLKNRVNRWGVEKKEVICHYKVIKVEKEDENDQ